LGAVPFFVLRSDLVLAEGYRDAFSGLASICGASLDGYARLLRRGESAGPLWLQEAYETANRDHELPAWCPSGGAYHSPLVGLAQ
jgi:hypothetical protein